ncbi:hypothetical protein CEXT_14691 [Caerostris extrusa]|uniref:Uncharacterized protein n=1 Tax=Caerostris extrusa TaxID=172846 RepID=A0AAV4VF93_CAEEX|nr:hypothetical protein CEXT_14691 [Caerostris extrusa]
MHITWAKCGKLVIFHVNGANQLIFILVSLDPSNHKVVEGSQRVEQNPESSESYEVDDIADSENEVIC